MTDTRRNLIELATAFAPYATLYQVGGCVRDMLLGVECYDIDVCSQLEVNDVKKALLNTDWVVSDKSLRMGTVHISRGDFVVEYTTFRTDSYNKDSGAHEPTNVRFTKDILLDARRRDFKCNAIYYDILKDEMVDVIGGRQDIDNKIVSTADEPSVVFEADGLRILRLVRFCAELGFDVESKTFEEAKRNAWRVRDIAIERVRDELEKIFVADKRHSELGLDDAHLRGLRLLDRLGLIEIILPEVNALKGLEQPKQYHLYDAFEHSVKAYELSPPHLRWASLLHDVGKAKAMSVDGNMHHHAEYGESIVNDILTRLRMPNDERIRISKLVRWHMVDINGNTSKSKLRRFIVSEIDYIEDVIALMNIDALACKGERKAVNRLREEYLAMLDEGLPLRISQLKVGGNDLIALNVKSEHRARILKQLLIDTAMNGVLNDRDRALKHIERLKCAFEKEDKKGI